MQKSMKESAVRARAKRLGYRIEKSRQAMHANNFGQYQLIEERINAVMLGGRFDASLEEIETFLSK